MPSIIIQSLTSQKGWRGISRTILAGALTLLPGIAAADVSQSPLIVGGNVPGNLVLTPSVEWPTINSVANLEKNYSENATYTGYFDAAKCYQYNYSVTETERHFNPVKTTNDHRCTTADAPWSGNFLNWAATQTIDPFRSGLAGGYRVKDTATETWLEKARHDGSGGTDIYPNRRLPDSGNNKSIVSGATPFNTKWIRMRIQGLGNKMRFRLKNDAVDDKLIDFDPANSDCSDHSCEISIRVKVCAEGLLESNCKEYANAWKPEGTLQEYANRMRYSVFGYLNDHDILRDDHDILRDGGALRARQKYIGPQKPDSDGKLVTNSNAEWDTTTGVLIQNPDPSDASATTTAVGQTINNSGVINYLTRFGQMTSKNHKSYDPVSELYYAATRYLKNQDNVPSYSNLTGSATNKYQLADGFPVITDWTKDDPVQYWCQANTILGIGDIYTHRDKNLPGNSTYWTEEPSMPPAVSADKTVDVITQTNQVGQMEGIGNIGSTNSFTGRNNSAFMAGLAWDNHVRDIRPDLSGGKTTVSTYWVDVLELQSLEGMARNQYALSAKYGGVHLPQDFDPDTWGDQPLPEAWWHTNGETLTPFGSRGNGQASFKRPDNFYLAGEAAAMIASLKSAFANIAAEMSGSGASLAANTTKLEAGSRTFHALFTSGRWSGDLNAYDVDPDTGALSTVPVWQASGKMPAWDSRNIYFYNPGSDTYTTFEWSNLSATQKTKLASEDTVNFLRGDRSKEQPDGSFRVRNSSLGDIVHSQPVYAGSPNPLALTGADFSGSSSYPAFALAQASRTPIIYVGANDGMLHGFNATTGVETFAFIPNAAIMSGLETLSDHNYQHKYFVDGELTIADAYYGGSWKTILVGTMGRGSPGLFALDITDPADVKFLWEKTDTDIPALGHNIGKPIIAQIANGDWRVILGNGPDNAAGTAQLIMVGIPSGTVATINTEVGNSNALSAVYTWDTTGDHLMDTAYAGDLKGNLWKFSSLSSNASFKKLFQAKNTSNQEQPITAAPLVGKNPHTAKRWVFFGTGQYLEESDLSDTTVQSWYGIIDDDTLIASRDDLEEREILAEGVINNHTARVIEQASGDDMVDKKGWYMDLVSPNNGIEGERIVVPNKFQGHVLIGTSRIPDSSDICRPTGRSFVMAINPFTGGRLDSTFFDFTGDGVFDAADMLTVNGELTITSGIGFDNGVNNPIFIGDNMQNSGDDGKTSSIKTQQSSPGSRRTSWREVTQ